MNRNFTILRSINVFAKFVAGLEDAKLASQIYRRMHGKLEKLTERF